MPGVTGWLDRLASGFKRSLPVTADGDGRENGRRRPVPNVEVTSMREIDDDEQQRSVVTAKDDDGIDWSEDGQWIKLFDNMIRMPDKMTFGRYGCRTCSFKGVFFIQSIIYFLSKGVHDSHGSGLIFSVKYLGRGTANNVESARPLGVRSFSCLRPSSFRVGTLGVHYCSPSYAALGCVVCFTPG